MRSSRFQTKAHRLTHTASTTCLFFTIIATLLLSACTAGPDNTNALATATPRSTGTPPPGSTATPRSVQIQETVLVNHLNIPWGLAFLPDGSALVTERGGRILAVDKEGHVQEVQRIPQQGVGEGGLLGIALSPNYVSDKLIYIYFSTNQDNRVARFQLGGDLHIILSGIPVAGNHNGGRIAFGPDGLLYIGAGDATNRPNAQSLKSLGGKILRIAPDGKIPDNNPFPGSPIYSYGHRNVQGLAWDSTGQLYATEFGQNTFDEVNKILPGKNYGWPEVEGMGNDKRFVNPLITFATSDASPSGATFLKNGAIPQWEGDFFMAALRGTRLWHLRFDADGKVLEKESLLLNAYGRLRLVTQAPDGSLWILTNNRDGRGTPIAEDDRIIRLGPA